MRAIATREWYEMGRTHNIHLKESQNLRSNGSLGMRNKGLLNLRLILRRAYFMFGWNN